MARSPSVRNVRSHRVLLRQGQLLEMLESRLLLSAVVPSSMRTAYGFDQLTQTGAGQTIAIIDAYDAPTVAADLDVFDKTYGLTTGGPTLYSQFGAASTFFTKHAMTSSIKADGGWAQEVALDVQWAHAVAPGASILLVEAASSSLADLIAAVNYAKTVANVSVVSMSWGSNEYSSETAYDATFTTPAGHQGITFVASSGDAGGVLSFPAVSSNVVAVGGTTLNVAASGAYTSETAWSGSGGGQSKIENASPAQAAFTGNKHRQNPDVAYDADPNTGFPVYDSYRVKGSVGWLQFGGTSAGAPQWAALIALANQGRGALGSLDGATQTIPALYSVSAGDFHDVTSGSTSRSISAKAGYDQATGRGSPVANLLVADLMGYGAAAPAGATTSAVVTTDSDASLSVEAGNQQAGGEASVEAAASAVAGFAETQEPVLPAGASNAEEAVAWAGPEWHQANVTGLTVQPGTHGLRHTKAAERLDLELVTD